MYLPISKIVLVDHVTDFRDTLNGADKRPTWGERPKSLRTSFPTYVYRFATMRFIFYATYVLCLYSRAQLALRPMHALSTAAATPLSPTPAALHGA